MKKCIIVIIAMLYGFLCANALYAADTWTPKTDFEGVARSYAVGFSIGTKGYIGTGFYQDSSSHYCREFWEYDPVANVWTQKTDFGGTARSGASGFSIGSKGYIGTGFDGYTYYKDFWEYDPAANTWTQKADFGGERWGASGFSIGSKGYIGTGSHGYTYYNDFWEYDPAANTWTKKTDFGGGWRYGASGFSIGDKGYIGTGNDSSLAKKDFWEYNPVLNTWTQKADVGGSTVRRNAVGFSIGTKGYIGTGFNGAGYSGSYLNDFWEYDQSINTWTQKTDFSGTVRSGAVGFSIGTKGYVGIGSDGLDRKDFREYSPVTNTDITPDQFIFTDQVNVALSTVSTSNSITVSGIDAAAPISISGGTYSINGGAYTNTSGTVSNGNTVTAQVISSGSYSTTANATLTIGGVSDTFSVTTLAATLSSTLYAAFPGSSLLSIRQHHLDRIHKTIPRRYVCLRFKPLCHLYRLRSL